MRRITRKDFLVQSGAGAAALALGNRWAGKAFAAGGSADTLTVGIPGDPGTLHPWILNGMPMYSTFWPTIYESVLWHDNKMQLVGGLAERWEVQGSDLKLFLRKGVVYHNGKPFDAESIKYAVEQITAPTSRSIFKSMVSPVKEVVIQDSHTVTLRMDKPFRSVLKNLVIVAMIEPNHAREAGDKLALQPVGTGPYKFVEYVPGSHMLVEANPNYYGPKPQVPRIRFRWIPENGTRVAALESGEVQLINNVPPDQIARVEANPNLKVMSAITARIIYMAMRTDRPPFNDKRVRQAINYAVDKEAIVKSILRGRGAVATSPIAPMVLGGEVKYPPYTYDPKKARALLKEAGAEGATVNLGSPSARFVMDRQVAQAVQGYLQNAGFKTTLEAPEWQTYLSEVVKFEKTKYDMFLLGWGVVTLEPDYEAREHFYSVFGKRWTGYVNPALDKAIDDAVVIMDPAKARDAYHTIFATVWDDAPWLFLHYQADLNAADKKVSFTPYADEWLRFASIKMAK